MNEKEAKKKISELVEKIEQHNYLYHTLDQPKITDQKYDKFFDQLLKLEKEFPKLKLKNSPTEKVGGEVLENFVKVEHREPMFSLQNTYSAEEIIEFENKIKRQLKVDGDLDFFCTPKYDGAAIEFVFKEGQLVTAITRGDGSTGEDVTSNAKTIGNLPLKLKTSKAPKRMDIRGEVLIFKQDFKNINEAQQEAGANPFANPRNAAAGTLRQLDPKIAASRKLQVFCYAPGFVDGIEFTSQFDFESSISKMALPIMPTTHNLKEMQNNKKWMLSKKCKGSKEVIEYYKAIEKIRHNLPFEIDGIVAKINSFSQQKKLGFVARSPRWAFAAKFTPDQEETKIKDILIQVGRTGALTPVAILEPVSVGGVTITHATLHNQGEIERKDIRVGDSVLVHRAGDVIPEVIEVVLKKRPKGVKVFKIPNKCPSCGQVAELLEGEAVKRCINNLCPAVMKESLKHFVSRNAMNIDKLGSRLIDILYEEKLITKFSDLYRLKQEELLELDRQGEKSSLNIISSIEKSKRTELHRFIYSLGIRFVGEQTARALADHYRSVAQFLKATEEELLELKDVGPKVTQSILASLKQKAFHKEVLALIELGIDIKKIKEQKSSEGGVLSGLTFVVTGTLPISRNDIHDQIRLAGGEVATSVSKKINVLLAGENAGSKMAKAQKLEIDIWDWSEFEKRLKNA